MTLSQSTVDIIKATVPILKEKGGTIILKFYDMLFVRYPDLKPFFNTDRLRGGVTTDGGLPAQVSALAREILAYAKHIDEISKIMPALESICHKHVARGVEASQYEAVGECMLTAISEVLGAEATPEITQAWTEAYKHLAAAFIDTEKRIRARLAEQAGFDGMAVMKVHKMRRTSSDDVEIAFRRVNGKPVGMYFDGQFVAISVTLENGQNTMTTVPLLQGEEGMISVLAGKSNEKASIALRNLQVGAIVVVSMPCGKARNVQ